MAAPTVYRSSDASAPSLTGTAGDLVNLLDKCLVSGYGSKTAAGWVRKTAFAGNGSTRAVFQQGAGNQFFLDVDDRGASSGLTGASGKEAAIRGYEAMTDVSTGTNPFPTTAQVAAATANWRKSATADATARGWVLIADDRTVYLFVSDGDTTSYKPYFFGDVYSMKSSDGYRTGIAVRTAVNSTSVNGTFLNSVTGTLTQSSVGHYVARIAAGTGTSTTVGISQEMFTNDAGFTIALSLDGNVYPYRRFCTDSATPTVRGYFRGIWGMLVIAGLNDGDTFSGTGDLAGRTFMYVPFQSGTHFGVIVETSAWDTSS